MLEIAYWAVGLIVAGGIVTFLAVLFGVAWLFGWAWTEFVHEYGWCRRAGCDHKSHGVRT
jgi:hypothetical protein